MGHRRLFGRRHHRNTEASSHGASAQMGNANGATRNMVVNSFADLDDTTVINQGTSDSRQPQLGFHAVHGQNVGLHNGGRVAKRKESFCKGLAFSNRPITVDENVCIRLNEVASNWSGVMRFGVTNVDPETYRGAVIPKFACPDLTSKDGYWAKALPERYSVEQNIIHFYITADGELFYGINGVQKGMFLSGINVRLPLWVIVDIYGNSVSVEFIDTAEFKPRGPRSLPAPSRPAPAVPSTPRPSTAATTSTQESYVPASNSHAYGGVDLDLLQFHRVTGRHITLNSLRSLATRSEQEYTQGYVFTERPVRVNEKILIQVVAVQQLYSGGIAFGVTCCDPQTLRGQDLPDDSSDLIEMPDYWVGIKDVALGPAPNTVLQFWITPAGEVKFQKDQKTPRTVMFVDVTLQLYMYFDVYGSTQVVKMLGSCPVGRAPSRPAAPAMPTRVALPVLPATTSRSSAASRRSEASPQRPDAPSSVTSLRVALDGIDDAGRRRPAIPPRRNTVGVDDLLSLDVPSPGPPPLSPAHSVSTTSATSATSSGIDSRPTSSLTASLNATTSGASSLLPGTPYLNLAPNPFRHLETSSSAPRVPPPLAPRPPMAHNRSAPQLPPTRPPPPPIPKSSIPSPTTAPVLLKNDLTDGTEGESGDECDECTVCMNAKINCVIYKCGHMCMCYDCATRTRDMNGECPICRKPMHDVIKCFKS